MSKASNVGLLIYAREVPIIPEAITFAAMGMIPAGSYSNQTFCSRYMDVSSGVDPLLLDLMADAQTSGGLLISVSENKVNTLVQKLRERKTPAASIIGEVLKDPSGIIQVC